MEAALDKSRPVASSAPSPAAGAKSSTFSRVIKLLLAIALIPACAGMTWGASDYFQGVWSRGGTQDLHSLLNWFGLGAAAFAAFTLLFWRPVVVYVFGHELMHALAAWMCLGKVSNLRASTTGGQVTISKSNTLIRLAPYCVPLYALLAAGLYLALNRWWRPLGGSFHWAVFALGFFYAFHIAFTLWSLRRDQPDLKPDGWFFSMVVVYLSNLAICALMLGFVSSGSVKEAWPALRGSGITGWHRSVEVYQNIAATGRRLINHEAPTRADTESSLK